LSLPISDGDLVDCKVAIFDPESQGFEQSQASAVEQQADQLRGSNHSFQEEDTHFFGREHYRQSGWLLGAHHTLQLLKVPLQHCLAKEQDCRQRLVLGRGGRVFMDGQVSRN
jgi:hypothetical protein